MGNLVGEVLIHSLETTEQFDWWLEDAVTTIKAVYPTVGYRKVKSLFFDTTLHYMLFEEETMTGTVDLASLGSCWKAAFYHLHQNTNPVSKPEVQKTYLTLASMLHLDLVNRAQLPNRSDSLISVIDSSAAMAPRELPAPDANRRIPKTNFIPKKNETKTNYIRYATHYEENKAQDRKHTFSATAEAMGVDTITVKRAMTFYKKYQKVSKIFI